MIEVPPSSARHSGLFAFVRRVLTWPARVAEARRTLALLGQMSDRELLDLGLLRSDLANCAALPLDEDPTVRLVRARAARAWFSPPRADRDADGASRAARPSERRLRRRREAGWRVTWLSMRIRYGLPYEHSLDRSIANRDNSFRK